MLDLLIKEELRVVVGLRIWGGARAAGMQGFQFGKSHIVPKWRGGVKTVGDYAIHIQCPWRITSPESIVTGSGDLSYPRGELNENFRGFDRTAAGPAGSRRDEKIEQWMRENPELTVIEVDGDPFGGAEIKFVGGYSLEILPADSGPGERWRLFAPHDDSPHFEVSGEGVFRAGVRLA